MTRVSTRRLMMISEELAPPEREIVAVVAELRLLSHAQLAALLPPPGGNLADDSRARVARRALARLTALGVLARTARRIGGVRAGSAGYLYYLGPVGQRLHAFWNGHGFVRGRYRGEPGGRYVRHRLAVSEFYVQARLAARAGELDLLAFEVEPACWRRSLDGFGGSTTLKPDAFVRLGSGAYEDRWFVEVDLATESRQVIARKVRAYVDYFHTGTEQAEHGVFPRVAILTTSEARRALLVDVCSRLPTEHWRLFAVTTLRQGLSLLAGQLEEAAIGLGDGGRG